MDLHCAPLSPDADVPGESEADRTLANLAKAVGHPVRAGIVRLLASQDRCMYGDLAELVPLARSTVSQHLKILREAGLLHERASGPRTCYCIDRVGLERLKGLVAGLGAVELEGARRP